MFALSRAIRRTHGLVCRKVFSQSFSTQPSYSILRTFAGALASKQPFFTVSPENVRILGQPSSFYATLLVRALLRFDLSFISYILKDMIRGARRRVFISSLYIGSSETELVRHHDIWSRISPISRRSTPSASRSSVIHL